MEFEYDEAKRLLTIARRKIDFLDMVEIFQSPHLVLQARSEIEERKIAVGRLRGSYFAVVFTMRGETIRIITARKARRDERERYQDLFSGPNPENEK